MKRALLSLLFLAFATNASAETLCQETAGAQKDRVTARPIACRGSERVVLGTAANPFGNQANGALVIESDSFLADPEFMYSSIVVRHGATLTVVSGTVLRARGGIAINGTLSVANGAQGGRMRGRTSDYLVPALKPAHPGIAAGAAGSGAVASSTVTAYGGDYSDAHSPYRSANLIHAFFPWGGGGGGASRGEGADGGGSLYLLAGDALAIGANGRIVADGDNGVAQTGAGGGGGGLILLASKTRINILSGAEVSAVGGAGGSGIDETDGSPTTATAPGGGGGGGIVMIAAPRISQLGAIIVTGGAAGTANFTSTSAAILVGGGAGGSSGGNGGAGAAVSVAQNGVGASEAGSVGWTIMFETDPTDLF